MLGSEKSPATKGKDPAQLFAKAVNEQDWGVNKNALVEFPPLIEGLKLLRDDRRPS